MTLASFSLSGKMPVLNTCFINVVRCLTIVGAICFKNFDEMLSRPQVDLASLRQEILAPCQRLRVIISELPSCLRWPSTWIATFMRRRYFDLCVTASSRTMLTFENNVSCSSRDCSTLASSCR